MHWQQQLILNADLTAAFCYCGSALTKEFRGWEDSEETERARVYLEAKVKSRISVEAITTSTPGVPRSLLSGLELTKPGVSKTDYGGKLLPLRGAEKPLLACLTTINALHTPRGIFLPSFSFIFCLFIFYFPLTFII